MANRIEGVSERILQCAKKEFLEKGFRDASLRAIAGNADTTPRSIYTRYGDKEGLFGALVIPALEILKNRNQKEQESYHNRSAEEQKSLFSDQKYQVTYQEMARATIDHIYDHFDEFKLLVDCSEGTAYENFMEDLIHTDIEYTLKYIEITENPALRSGKASRDLVEVLCQFQYEGFFKIVQRGMTREEAYIFTQQLHTFFQNGWKLLLQTNADNL